MERKTKQKGKREMRKEEEEELDRQLREIFKANQLTISHEKRGSLLRIFPPLYF